MTRPNPENDPRPRGSRPHDAGLSVRRQAQVPDSRRLERCLRLPEFGPRVFFFSGGTAMRDTSRVLKRYTHNSIHLITPFDSGGSSAALREAFGILGVGDLRNRLMALADESALGSPKVSALFAHRLDPQADPTELRRELDQLTEGAHPLVRAVPETLRSVVLTNLRGFAREMPATFDLRDASVGNLLLAGGYLANQRDLDAVLYLFSKLVTVRGTVRPTAVEDVHLVAVHANGQRTVGQHRIGKPATREHGSIAGIELTSCLEGGEPVEVDADPNSLELISGADLVCFPMGSFYGSVLANLLPRGVGRAVLASGSPRVYIPNAGDDPEMSGLSIVDCVARITELVARDVDGEVAPADVLDFVLVDSRGVRYGSELDLQGLADLGLQVIDTPLASSGGESLDPTCLVEALLSLA